MNIPLPFSVCLGGHCPCTQAGGGGSSGVRFRWMMASHGDWPTSSGLASLMHTARFGPGSSLSFVCQSVRPPTGVRWCGYCMREGGFITRHNSRPLPDHVHHSDKDRRRCFHKSSTKPFRNQLASVNVCSQAAARHLCQKLIVFSYASQWRWLALAKCCVVRGMMP